MKLSTFGDPGDLDLLEAKYIAEYDSVLNGYNCNAGGNRPLLSLDSRRRISTRNRELFAAGHRSHVGSRNPFFGKTHTQGTRDLIAATLSGRIATEAHRQAISASLKGRTFSEVHSKRKSEAQLGDKNPTVRSVVVDGQSYGTITEASAHLGVKYTTVVYRLNSRNYPSYEYSHASL